MSVQSSAPSRRLSLFDLDNTLLAGDSDHRWGQFMVRHRLVDPDEYERRNAAFYDDYRAAASSTRWRTWNSASHRYARYPRDELDRWHRRFMAETIRADDDGEGQGAGRRNGGRPAIWLPSPPAPMASSPARSREPTGSSI